MTDIRLKEIPYQYNGKTYMLRCNFNVLAEIVNYFGKVPEVKRRLDLNVYTAVLAFAMNEYADEMKWSERFTPKEIGRTLDVRMLNDEKGRDEIQSVMNLLIGALYTRREDSDTQENNEKN